MKKLTLLLLFAVSFQYVCAQDHLLGLWEGVMTDGGLGSNEGYRFELYILEITKEGKMIGRSYVYLGDQEIIEMDIEGILYSDRSIYFRDTNFIELDGSPVKAPYNRKYQVIYNRSIFDSSIEGYWQEIFPDPFFPTRQRGRIKLKKAEVSEP